MAVRVSPTEANPTHHISLSDGTTTIGLNLCDGKGNITPLGLRQSGVPRTSLQIRQGDPDYSSYELPYTTLTQKDWSGGRALEDFTKDSTRFYDAYRVDTRHGDAILGPAGTSTLTKTKTLIKAGATIIDPATGLHASSFVAPADMGVRTVTVTIGPGPIGAVVASIYEDSAGEPAATAKVTAILQLPTPGGVATDPYDVSGNLSCYLVSGSTYWFVVSGGPLYYGADAACTVKQKIGGGAWTTVHATSTLAFTLNYSINSRNIFFEYKYSLFCMSNNDTGVLPTLYRNGYRGAATSNATDKTKLNTALNLSGIDLSGKVAMVWSGPGSSERQNWRIIESNTTTGANDSITVTEPWQTTHSTASLFVILGCTNWEPMTTGAASATAIPSLSTYLLGPVTDILVVDGTIYIAQGDGVNICRLNLLGTEVWSTAAPDSTNKADWLIHITASNGTRYIWKAIAQGATIARAVAVAWGSNLTFSTAKACGNTRTKITGIEAYSNPQIPYVLKEDSIGSVASINDAALDSFTYSEVHQRELLSVRDTYNGRAHCQFGVYLFFSMGQGLERFYENRLDDMGPNLDEGFPTGRQGYITQLLPYPGGIFAIVDAGTTGYSSIMFWNQMGWHEVYRSMVQQNRINDIFVQTIPGDTLDRLWFGMNEDLFYFPICLNPRKETGYAYTTITGPAPHLITAWISGGFKEITKFWKSVTLFTEGLSANVNITASYQTDNATDSTTWTDLPTTFTTSPVQEVLVATANDVSGKRIRFKLTFTSNSASLTPRLKAMTVDSVTRLPVKRAWTVTFRADDAMRDLSTGASEALTASGLISQCASWADSATRATPVTFRNIWPTFDNNSVFIDPLSITPQSVQVNIGGTRREVQICTMTMYEA